MSHNRQSLEELGRQVAEHMGEGPPPEERSANKEAILRHAVAAAKHSRSTNQGWRIGFAAAAAIAVIISAVAFWQTGPSQIDYWVGHEPASSDPGRWIKAPTAAPLAVRFENGDNLELSGNASLRVLDSNSESISIALDSGAITARVNKENGSNFSVKAGPYWIYDIGTVFSVDWSPEQMKLNVNVEEGLVHIVGGTLPEQGIRIAAGDSYLYPPHNEQLAAQPPKIKAPTGESTPIDALAPSAEIAEPILPAPDQHRALGAKRTVRSNVHKQAPSTDTAHQPEWARHLSHGDFAKAVEAAKDENLRDVAQAVSGKDLWALAQAARYARDGKSAKRLLQFYRERFGDAPRAKTAAFLIGRIELELFGNPSAAAQWFQTYLSQGPGGDLAEEALGRLIQVHQQLGDGAKTQRAAAQYREKYPNGLYKRLADSILDK